MSMVIPRLRTATGVLQEIKKLDPETGITEYYIRQLIREQQIPITHAGKKCLVDLDQVLGLIGVGTSRNSSGKTGEIRPVQI